MDTLYELIIKISEDPKRFIHRPTLDLFYVFICGYLIGNPSANDHCLEGFNQYVAKVYSIESEHNWATIITFFSESDDEAFELFKSLFSKFQQEKKQSPNR